VIAHAEGVRVAGELREILRRSRAARPHLWRASQAGSPDGRDPLLRMARVHAPGTGPQRPVFVPSGCCFRADRAL